MTTHPRTPDGRPPSAEACAQVAAALEDRLAATRLAWEAALLRSDAALAEGDPAEIEAALTEQRAVLAQLEGGVAAALGIAVPAGVGTASEDRDPGASSDGDQVASPPPPGRAPSATAPRGGARGRGRAPALSGALAGVAIVVGLWGVPASAPTGTPEGTVVAASGATATDTVVELRATASDVVRRNPLVVADVAGPTRELAPFSGNLPVTATRAAPPPASDAADGEPSAPTADPGVGSERHAEVERETTAEREQPTPAPSSATDGPVEPVEDLVPDLPGRDADDRRGPDVASSAPATLEEVADEVRRLLQGPLASDPTVGLR